MNTQVNNRLVLIPGLVEVFVFDLTRMVEFELHPERFLSTDELSRGNIYKFERDRQLFYARRMLLRRLLARYIEVPAKDINYQTSPFGKLSLETGTPFFSLSTSQNRVAFAFTDSGTVGVDLEEVRPLDDLPGLIQRNCSTLEKALFAALPQKLRLEAFFHMWTQKEAYLKACGAGFSIEPCLLTVEVDPRKPGRLIDIPGGEASSWQVVTTLLEPGWRVGVCCQMKEKSRVILKTDNPESFIYPFAL